MKKIEETTQRVYTKEQVLNNIAWLVNSYHKALAADTRNGVYHETFGEWKRENPRHRLANKNYPKNEFVEVISAYINYFNELYDKPREEKKEW